MNLVVGSSGFLGTLVCRALRDRGLPVRAMVRPNTDLTKRDDLIAWGAVLVEGDLKTPPSLEIALRGVHTIISTATSTVSRQPNDSIESVDLRGHFHLVEAAKRAGVEHFIYVSFGKQELDFPLQTAKRAVENQLTASGIPYTIFHPVYFMEAWLGPALGFDPIGHHARTFGDGNAKTSWISAYDVARFVAGAVGLQATRNRVLPLGGPAALSQREAITIFQDAGCGPVEVGSVSEHDLERQFAEATDPLARSFAAMMLGAARGIQASSASALELIELKLKSVEQYAKEQLISQQPR